MTKLEENLNLEMEDNRIFWQKKTTSISREMKDDLKMEDDLNFKE
jgi:hypothetical protein